MADSKMINGIDTGHLGQIIHTVREEPATGKCLFRARHRWGGGDFFVSTIQDFQIGGTEYTARPEPFVIEGGEPEALAGYNSGPNATEAALHALATCLSTTLIYHAAAHGIKIDELQLEIEGDLDLRGFLAISDDVRRGFQNIRVNFTITADHPAEKIREVCEMAQKYSPVFDIVTNRVPVSATYQMKGTDQKTDVSFHKGDQREAA